MECERNLREENDGNFSYKRKHCGGFHQTCSVLCVDNDCLISQSKLHLEQMIKKLIGEAEEFDLDPKLASLEWTS